MTGLEEITADAVQAFRDAHKRWRLVGPMIDGSYRVMDDLPVDFRLQEVRAAASQEYRMYPCKDAEEAQRLKFRLCIEAVVKTVRESNRKLKRGTNGRNTGTD